MNTGTTVRLALRLARPRSGIWWTLPVLVLTLVLTLVYVVLVRMEWSAADAREYRFGGSDTAVYFNALVPTTQASFTLTDAVAEVSALTGSEACAEVRAITQTDTRDSNTYAYREFQTPCAAQAWGYELVSGRWAAAPGEVVATPATRLNEGDILEGLTPGVLTVVGIASTPHAINARALLAAPGTWRSWDWPSASTAFPHLSATVVAYLNTPDSDALAAAFAARASTDPAAASVVVDSLAVTGRTVIDRMPYLYLWVAAPIGALAAGIALALRAKFSTDRRRVLLAQGTAPRQAIAVIRLAELVMLAPALIVGLLTGWALGTLAAPVIPQIIGHQASATPPAWDPLVRLTLGVGIVWGLLFLRSMFRRTRHPDTRPARSLGLSRTWRFSLAGLLALAGVALTATAQDVSFIFAAVLLLVGAIGLVAADGLTLVAARVRHGRADTRLAWRRIADRPAGSALAATAAALTVGPVIAMMVLLTSDIAAQNEQERLPPRQDQALYYPTSDEAVNARIVALVTEAAGEDVSVVTVSAPMTRDGQGIVATPDGFGSIETVTSVNALNDLLGAPVPDGASTVLEGGGILWNDSHSGLTAWTVGAGAQETVTFAAELSLPFERRWANSTAGFILDETATSLDLILDPNAIAFSGVTEEDAQAIGDALVQAGYDGSLVRTYRAEDPFTVTPFQLGLLAAVGVVGVALFAIAVRGIADALRRQSTSLIALGVPRTWLARVFTREAGTLLLLGVTAGTVLSGCITAIGILQLGISVEAPLAPIAAYLFGILVLFATLGAIGFTRVRT
ncbi:hypothetical protein [Microbacterium aurum]